MINVSVVLYHTDKQQLMLLLNTLLQSTRVNKIFLVDNSEQEIKEYRLLFMELSDRIEYIFNNQNLGYGAAHNIGLRKTLQSQIEYHLVVNSDIEFDPKILDEMENYMSANPSVGQMMPKVVYPDGKLQYLCKLLPTPLDLLGRRFLPDYIMKRRMDRFELRHTGYNKIMNIPYLSGCFMLLRTEALQQVGLFDERYFMYPEDIDLTRRIHQKYQTLFYPFATVIHHHKQGSYKSLKLLMVHIVNICKYFNKWGCFFDSERRKVNKATFAQNA